MGEYILKLDGISKSFFGVPALQGVSFSLKKGQLLGLIGENGAGKSTLMNIIGGVLKPDSGCMIYDDSEYAPGNPADASSAGIAFIHQELNLFLNLSIAENIFICNFPKISGLPFIEKGSMKQKTKKLLESIDLQVSPDILVEKLSPGERQLVEIAKALSCNPKVIIFDEPTTSLTARETERLFELIEKLKSEGISIIYISHILDDVKRLADEIVVLRDGQVTDQDCVSCFSVNRMISSMVGRDIKQLYPEKTNKPSNEKAMEVRSVSQRGIVADISFHLNKGEVLGVFGLMGSGRTELARILFGLDRYESGEIIIDNEPIKKITPQKAIEKGVAFVTENRREEGLLMDVSIAENVGLASLDKYSNNFLRFISKSSMYSAVKEVVGTLKLKSGPVEKSVPKSLSGGNQQKVVIGKWLLSNPGVLMVDEPTRGIDVGAKYEVYSIINNLASNGTGVLIISSELEELIGTCDRIIVMNKGDIVGQFNSNDFDRQKVLAAAFRQETD